MTPRIIIGILIGIALSAQVQAAVIFDNFDGAPLVSELRTTPGNAILTRIEVGATGQDISGFGVHGTLSAAGNAKAAIFGSPGPLPLSGFSPLTRLFVSNPIAVAPQGVPGWYDVSDFAFTLAADTSYYLGVYFDQPFTYDWDSAATTTVPLTQNGITSPGELAGSNANGIDYDDPAASTGGNVIQSLRIFGAESVPESVPEPATLLLLVLGLAGLEFAKKRQS